MKHLAVAALAIATAFAPSLVACGGGDDDRPRKAELLDVPGHDGAPVDTRRPQGPRTLAAESYLRSYMMLFGASSPAEVARLARGSDGNEVFETWEAHVGALGLPDRGNDIARAAETNALMLGAYERLGMALCERAAERDLRASTGRTVFDFAPAGNPLDRVAFDAGFDSLHRTFLGYPAKHAPGRSDAFFRLYGDVVARHGLAGVTSRLSPAEAGWASVCEGLLRHPEFHLY